MNNASTNTTSAGRYRIVGNRQVMKFFDSIVKLFISGSELQLWEALLSSVFSVFSVFPLHGLPGLAFMVLFFVYLCILTCSIVCLSSFWLLKWSPFWDTWSLNRNNPSWCLRSSMYVSAVLSGMIFGYTPTWCGGVAALRRCLPSGLQWYKVLAITSSHGRFEMFWEEIRASDSNIGEGMRLLCWDYWAQKLRKRSNCAKPVSHPKPIDSRPVSHRLRLARNFLAGMALVTFAMAGHQTAATHRVLSACGGVLRKGPWPTREVQYLSFLAIFVRFWCCGAWIECNLLVFQPAFSYLCCWGMSTCIVSPVGVFLSYLKVAILS